MSKSGFVYVMLNPAFPGLVKVGMTERTVNMRARELRTTGVPSRFIVLWQEYVSDANAVEEAMHKRFTGYRYEEDREFFSVPPQEAIRALIEESTKLARPLQAPSASKDVLPHLRELLQNGLRNDIVSAQLKQDNDLCYLEVIRRPATPYYGDEIIERTDLSVVADQFSTKVPFAKNVQDFIDLTPYDLANITDVMTPEAAQTTYDEFMRDKNAR
jgi:hypothetical protein